MSTTTDEDLAILETLERMKNVPCCERPSTGCFRKHGDCCCSCPSCLCAYTAFQIEEGDALISRFLPKLGYAIVVEMTHFEDRVEGGEIVALIAPGRVWFPETSAGWLSIPASKEEPPGRSDAPSSIGESFCRQ